MLFTHLINLISCSFPCTGLLIQVFNIAPTAQNGLFLSLKQLLKPQLFLKFFPVLIFSVTFGLIIPPMLLLMVFFIHPIPVILQSPSSFVKPSQTTTAQFTLYLTFYWMVFIIYLTITKMSLFTILNLSFFTYKRITSLALISLEKLPQNDLVENNDQVRKGKNPPNQIGWYE